MFLPGRIPYNQEKEECEPLKTFVSLPPENEHEIQNYILSQPVPPLRQGALRMLDFVRKKA
jgi:hypothetical protein